MPIYLYLKPLQGEVLRIEVYREKGGRLFH